MTSGDAIYWLAWIGGTVAVIGCLVTARWALFADRDAGRRRCPKCWYDMTESPGMTCSECGRTARAERDLHRTKRRWLWAITASLGAAVIIGWLISEVRERGWARLTPTKALILALPIVGSERGQAFDELWVRLTRDELSTREWSMLAERCLDGDWWAEPGSDEWIGKYGPIVRGWHERLASDEQLTQRLWSLPVRVEVTSRELWPRGTDVCVEAELRNWRPTGSETRLHITARRGDAPLNGGPTAMQTLTLLHHTGRAWATSYPFTLDPALLPESAGEVVFDVRVECRRPTKEGPGPWSAAGAHEIRVPLRIVDELDERPQPVRGEELDSLMRSVFGMGLRLSPAATDFYRMYFNRQASSVESLDGTAVAAVVNIMRGEQVAATYHIWWLAGPREERFIGSWQLPFVDEPMLRTAGDEPLGEGWTIRVRGDADLALRVPGAEQFWAGEFTLPLRVEKAPQPFSPRRWRKE